MYFLLRFFPSLLINNLEISLANITLKHWKQCCIRSRPLLDTTKCFSVQIRLEKVRNAIWQNTIRSIIWISKPQLLQGDTFYYKPIVYLFYCSTNFLKFNDLHIPTHSWSNMQKVNACISSPSMHIVGNNPQTVQVLLIQFNSLITNEQQIL